MEHSKLSEDRRETIRNYFRFANSGDARWFDLYTHDAELTFPKFGTARGKESLLGFIERMGAMIRKLEHDIDGLSFIETADTIVVEGREWGEMADGTPFPDGKVSEGRFCNVFEFRGTQIRAVRIYADPDFASRDANRIVLLQQ